jgi:hypothetical protein
MAINHYRMLHKTIYHRRSIEFIEESGAGDLAFLIQ